MSDEDDFFGLIEQCLDREYSVEIVRCGQYARPGEPYLCCVRHGHGTARRDHLVYGGDAIAIMKVAMTHVLTHGFTQQQDRYGLGGG